MPKYSTAFGMDVHLRSTTVCALDAETGEAVTRRFRGNPWGEVAEWMLGFPGPSLAAYESGYLGFAPQRELSGLGVDCVVAAVSKSRGRRPTSRPRTTATTRPGWPRRYCRTTSPRYGYRPPRSRGSGTSPPPTVSVNIFFTIFTNVFSPIAPTRMRRIRQRGCAAFGV